MEFTLEMAGGTLWVRDCFGIQLFLWPQGCLSALPQRSASGLSHRSAACIHMELRTLIGPSCTGCNSLLVFDIDVESALRRSLSFLRMKKNVGLNASALSLSSQPELSLSSATSFAQCHAHFRAGPPVSPSELRRESATNFSASRSSPGAAGRRPRNMLSWHPPPLTVRPRTSCVTKCGRDVVANMVTNIAIILA